MPGPRDLLEAGRKAAQEAAAKKAEAAEASAREREAKKTTLEKKRDSVGQAAAEAEAEAAEWVTATQEADAEEAKLGAEIPPETKANFDALRQGSAAQTERAQTLKNELAQIDAEIAALESGASEAAPSATPEAEQPLAEVPVAEQPKPPEATPEAAKSNLPKDFEGLEAIGEAKKAYDELGALIQFAQKTQWDKMTSDERMTTLENMSVGIKKALALANESVAEALTLKGPAVAWKMYGMFQNTDIIGKAIASLDAEEALLSKQTGQKNQVYRLDEFTVRQIVSLANKGIEINKANGGNMEDAGLEAGARLDIIKSLMNRVGVAGAGMPSFLEKGRLDRDAVTFLKQEKDRIVAAVGGERRLGRNDEYESQSLGRFLDRMGKE